MSSERRVVRPYAGIDGFQSALDKWTLRVGPEELFAGEHRTITSSSFLHDPPLLIAALDDDALAELRAQVDGACESSGIPAADLELVVVASTPYLRFADVVFRTRLDDKDALFSQLDLSQVDPKPKALQTPNGGCNIDAYFLLAEDDPSPQPLRPSRAGTWLGHVRFALKTELGDVGFRPRALTDEIRENYELPKGTIRYVSIEPDFLVGDDASNIELYVDVDLLSQLNQSTNTPFARFLQRQFFLDVVSAITRVVGMNEQLRQLELTEFEDSVLDRIIGVAAGKGERGEPKADGVARRQKAWDMMRNDPEKFMAWVEDAVAPKSDLKATLGGGDE